MSDSRPTKRGQFDTHLDTSDVDNLKAAIIKLDASLRSEFDKSAVTANRDAFIRTAQSTFNRARVFEKYEFEAKADAADFSGFSKNKKMLLKELGHLTETHTTQWEAEDEFYLQLVAEKIKQIVLAICAMVNAWLETPRWVQNLKRTLSELQDCLHIGNTYAFSQEKRDAFVQAVAGALNANELPSVNFMHQSGSVMCDTAFLKKYHHVDFTDLEEKVLALNTSIDAFTNDNRILVEISFIPIKDEALEVCALANVWLEEVRRYR